MRNNGLSCHVSQSVKSRNWIGDTRENDTITAHGACKYYWAWVWCYTANEDWTPVASFFAGSKESDASSESKEEWHRTRWMWNWFPLNWLDDWLGGWMNEGSLYSDSWFPGVHSFKYSVARHKGHFFRGQTTSSTSSSKPSITAFVDSRWHNLWRAEHLRTILLHSM